MSIRRRASARKAHIQLKEGSGAAGRLLLLLLGEVRAWAVLSRLLLLLLLEIPLLLLLSCLSAH